LRLFDLALASSPLSENSKRQLSELGCAGVQSVEDLFRVRVKNLPSRCLISIRRLLKEDLKIEALAYSHPTQKLAECSFPSKGRGAGYGAVFHQSALVLINSERISPTDVRVINASTTDAADDRLMIASFFYKMYAELYGPEKVFASMLNAG